jgi:hypothetical protein
VSHIDPSGILLLIRVQGRKAIVIASHDPPVEPARRHHRRLLSEAMGRSGRAAIQARIEGATDPAKLAGARLGEALQRQIKPHSRGLLHCICNRSTR